MPVIGRTHYHSEHAFTIEITRDNVHELIVWGKWCELDMWSIYDTFICAEKAGSKIYLILNTQGFTNIYATTHTPKTFRTMSYDEFVKSYREVEDRKQTDQFNHRLQFKFTEIEKI